MPADVTGEMWDGWRGNQSEFGYEAPTMFKRNGIYYAMFGYQCCFCEQGSGIRVYTATAPLGPYVYQGGHDLACYNPPTPAPTPAPTHKPTRAPTAAPTRRPHPTPAPTRRPHPTVAPTRRRPDLNDSAVAAKAAVGRFSTEVMFGGEAGGEPEPSPGQGCQHMDADAISSTRSQQNFVFEVRRGEDTTRGDSSAARADRSLCWWGQVEQVDGSTGYIWTGDRWGQSPDGIKGHEPQFWAPLEFRRDGSVRFVQWIDSFDLHVRTWEDDAAAGSAQA
jgi:hypothetical protein